MGDRIKRFNRRELIKQKSEVSDPYPDYPNDRILIDKDDEKLLVDLEEGLVIDENGLDEGLLQQPDLFYRVSKTLALRVSRRDAAKQYLATVEARIDAMLRRKARETESKMTEKELDSQKRTHVDVDKALNIFLRLSHSVGQFSALKEAYQQRSYVLKSLIDLYVAGYFGNLTHNSSGDSLKNVHSRHAREAMNKQRRELD